MAIDYLSALNQNGSGLNLTDLASSLVSADIAPKAQAAETTKNKAETSISAYAQLRSAFEEFDTALGYMSGTSVLAATSSNSAVSVEVTDRNAVQETTSYVDVIEVAKRQVLEFTGFSGPDEVIGTGNLTVDVGVWADSTTFAVNPDATSNTITIGEGATLDELAQALSSLDGVTARVLDRGDGTFTLGIVSEEGAGNALRLTADAGATGSLATLDNTTTNATSQVQAAADAMLTVDGVTVFRSTNVIGDVVDGLTFTLNGTTDYAASINVSRDASLASEVLNAFVDQVNTTLTKLKDMTAYATEDSEAGDLYGDRTVKRLSNQLTDILNEPLTGFGDDPVYLSDLGIATARDGSIYLNDALFERAFVKNPGAFDALFQNSFSSDNSAVTISGKPNNSTVAGTYSFNFDPATGIATVDGSPLFASVLDTGEMSFVATTGNMSGAVLTSGTDAVSANVTFGRSMVSKLQASLNEALQTNGTLDKRDEYFTGIVTEQTETLKAIDERATELETRYLRKFAAMEQVITELKSTGEYLTAMVDSWNNSN